MGNDALVVTNISVEYHSGIRAVREVSFSIGEGEFVALLGPSGCGKSSLLAAIAGFLRPSHGMISAFGDEVVGPAADRGIAFQHHSLFPWKSALDNLTYPLEVKGRDRATARERALRWLKEVGLEGFDNFHPSQLSGGMQQRVAVARLFISDPRIFLLDEPFGALDAYTKLQMQELLLRIWEKHRRTVLFVTHDIEEALLLADRVLIMSAAPGTIVEEFTVPLQRPRSVAALFAPEVVTLRQHVLSLMQQEHRKKMLFKVDSTARGRRRTLRLGYVPDVAALPLLAASEVVSREQKPELVMEPNGDVIIEEVSSGQLDLGEVSLVSALLAARRGKQFKIISGWATFDPSSADLMAIYSSDRSAAGRIQSLLGKRVGLNGFGTLSEYLIRRAFHDLGQTPQLVSLRSESFRFALERNIVEGVAAMQPWSGLLRNTPGFVRVCSLQAYLPPDPLFILVANQETIDSCGQTIAQLLKQCRASWAEIQSSEEFRNELVQQYLGVQLTDSSGSLTLRPSEAVKVQDLEALASSLSQIGMIKDGGRFEGSSLLQLVS
jgi:NitT/TauT family transport system ATP-binding protein